MRDRSYRPSRVITDIYFGIDPKPFSELGLSPYAMVGSLRGTSPGSRVEYHEWVKPDINYHSYTYVGPFIGPTLSPNDRHLSILNKKSDREQLKLAISQNPTPIIAALAMVSALAEADLDKEQMDASTFSTSILPVFLAFIGLLLIFYASIVTPSSQRNTNNPNTTQHYSSQIIYNRY